MTNLILCPTRGGAGSFPNQDRAIAIAKERGAAVMFLYISNVEFLDLSASPKVIDIETEIDEMGEFLMAMAQERAEKAGVKALTLVRRGHFRDMLIEVIEENQIDTVVLGRSVEGSGVITAEYIRELGSHISAKTGVEFIVLEKGEIVSTYKQ